MPLSSPCSYSMVSRIFQTHFNFAESTMLIFSVTSEFARFIWTNKIRQLKHCFTTTGRFTYELRLCEVFFRNSVDQAFPFFRFRLSFYCNGNVPLTLSWIPYWFKKLQKISKVRMQEMLLVKHQWLTTVASFLSIKDISFTKIFTLKIVTKNLLRYTQDTTFT